MPRGSLHSRLSGESSLQTAGVPSTPGSGIQTLLSDDLSDRFSGIRPGPRAGRGSLTASLREGYTSHLESRGGETRLPPE